MLRFSNSFQPSLSWRRRNGRDRVNCPFRGALCPLEPGVWAMTEVQEPPVPWGPGLILKLILEVTTTFSFGPATLECCRNHCQRNHSPRHSSNALPYHSFFMYFKNCKYVNSLHWLPIQTSNSRLPDYCIIVDPIKLISFEDSYKSLQYTNHSPPLEQVVYS